ncbi:hypothetical protein C8R43DRAFT_832208, partial [Mycena crocata]
IDDVRNAQLFIKALDGATLDNGDLPADVVHRLRNPIQSCVDIKDNKDFRLSLDLFLADTYASEATYKKSVDGVHRHSPHVKLLSHYEIKKQIEELTGVTPISYDMCIESCIAYTAHFSNLEHCMKCGESRYNPVALERSGGLTKVARRKFDTIPIGPVLQALWRSKEGARLM